MYLLIGELKALVFKAITELCVLIRLILLLNFDAAVFVLSGNLCFNNYVLYFFLHKIGGGLFLFWKILL